jgi:hypothetical protein
MAQATLIKEDQNSRIYRNSKGQSIKVEMDDDQQVFTIYDFSSNELGEFIFKELDFGRGYKLIRMYCNEVKQTGIGRAILEYFREAVGSPIYVSPNDGITRNDGSHLTEDAPSFVQHMIAEKLIDGYENEPLYNDKEINGFF